MRKSREQTTSGARNRDKIKVPKGQSNENYTYQFQRSWGGT